MFSILENTCSRDGTLKWRKNALQAQDYVTQCLLFQGTAKARANITIKISVDHRLHDIPHMDWIFFSSFFPLP